MQRARVLSYLLRSGAPITRVLSCFWSLGVQKAGVFCVFYGPGLQLLEFYRAVWGCVCQKLVFYRVFGAWLSKKLVFIVFFGFRFVFPSACHGFLWNSVLGDRHDQARPGSARVGQGRFLGGCFHRSLLASLVRGKLGHTRRTEGRRILLFNTRVPIT